MPDEPDGWKKEFNSESRSRVYDRIIDLFSLRRAERFGVLRQLLPQFSRQDANILELGTGTGVLTELLLQHYRKAFICTIEGAEKMIEQASAKVVFERNRERIRLLHEDFSSPSWKAGLESSFDLIVTFDSLHHLSHDRKKALYAEIYGLLAQGASFIISDHVVSSGRFFEDPQYDLWLQGIHDNLKGVVRGSDVSSALESATHWTYEDVQRLSYQALKDIFTANLKREGDNPMPLMEHIDGMRSIGFVDVTVAYRFANYAIISAVK